MQSLVAVRRDISKYLENTMSNLTNRVAQTVGRHFVTLSCIQRMASDPAEKVFVFSGFLVDVAGIWFYVTAGHILKDIRTSLTQRHSYFT